MIGHRLVQCNGAKAQRHKSAKVQRHNVAFIDSLAQYLSTVQYGTSQQSGSMLYNGTVLYNSVALKQLCNDNGTVLAKKKTKNK